MMGATQKQDQLLGSIKAYVESRGVAPTFEEMRQRMQLGSKSGIYRMVLALEERGLIRRLPNRARAIEVVAEGSRDAATPVTTDKALAALLRPEQIEYINKMAAAEHIQPSTLLRDMVEAWREGDL